MKPATQEDMVEASTPPQPAKKWPGETGDAPQDDPDYEAIKSGVFDMTPEELDALDQMVQEARARMSKGDPGGNVKL